MQKLPSRCELLQRNVRLQFLAEMRERKYCKFGNCYGNVPVILYPYGGRSNGLESLKGALRNEKIRT